MRVERRNSSEDPDPAFTWSDQRAQITSHPARIDWYLMTLHCPSCGSAALVLEAGGYGGMVYRCKECGYRGSFVVESDASETIEGRDTGAPEHILQEKERGIPGTALG